VSTRDDQGSVNGRSASQSRPIPDGETSSSTPASKEDSQYPDESEPTGDNAGAREEGGTVDSTSFSSPRVSYPFILRLVVLVKLLYAMW